MSVNPWDAIPADDELKSRVWDSVPADIDVKPWDSVAADADMKPWDQVPPDSGGEGVLKATGKAMVRGTYGAISNLGSFMRRQGLERMIGPAPEEPISEPAIESGQGMLSALEGYESPLSAGEIKEGGEAYAGALSRGQQQRYEKRLADESTLEKTIRTEGGRKLIQEGRAVESFGLAGQKEWKPEDYTATRSFIENLKDEPLKTTLTTVAENLPNMAVSIASVLATRRALGPVGVPVGAGAASYAMETGDIFNEGSDYLAEKYGSIEQVPEAEWSKLVEVTRQHGSLNAALDTLPILNLFKKTGAEQAVKAGVIRRLMSLEGGKAVTKEGIKQLVGEVVTEVGQEESTMSAMERTGKTITPEERRNRYVQAAVAAGGLGGATGVYHAASEIVETQKGHKAVVDEFKETIAQDKISEIPDSDMTWAVSKAEELAAQDPADQDLGQTVLAMKAEQARRQTVQPTEETGTMAPAEAPVMEPEVAATLAMQPGAQYKGMVTDTESVLRSQQTQAAPVETGIFSGEQAVVRREGIIKKLSKALGYPVYQGRIRKGKRELGFYKPRTDEVRIKNRNDIEVTAHEIAHLLDYTEKTFRQGYHQKVFKEEVRSLSYDKTKLHEGFAEFVRHWMTDTNYAREKAPKFTAWFEKTLTGHRHEKAIRAAQAEMHAWFSQGMISRFDSKIGQAPETLRERVSRITDKLRDRAISQMGDVFHGFKLMEQDLGGPDTQALPAYMAVRTLAGIRMQIRSVFEHGTINFRPDGTVYFTGASLQDVFSEVHDDLRATLRYFAARRARELMSQGRERNFTKAEIDAVLEDGERHAEGETESKHQRAHQKWLAFNQRMLDMMQTAGVLSEETRANFDRMNREHVSFRRVIESVTGQPIRNTGSAQVLFMRLTGGTANVNDILENIVFNVEHMVEAAMTNRAKQQIYNLVGTKKGGAKYAVRIAPEIKPAWVDKAQVIKKMQELGVQNIPPNIDDTMTFFTYGHPPKGLNIDVVFYKGKPAYFETAPGADLFLRAVHGFGTKPYSLALRITGGFKTTLTAMTTLALEFVQVNSIRDTANSFLTTKTGHVPVVDSVRGYLHAITKDPIYWEAMANGVGMSTVSQGSLDQFKYRLESFYSKNGVDYNTVLDTPARILDWYVDHVTAVEYGPRLREFEKLREAGKSGVESAVGGRDLSTDFGMHGASDFLRIFTMSVPFLGANIQGVYRGLRAIAPKALHATGEGESFRRLAVKGLVGITLPSLALLLYNLRDEKDDRYKSLREWERRLHWVILSEDKEKPAVLIPKPFDFGALFATIPEIITEAIIKRMNNAQEGDGIKFAKALGWVLMNQFGIGGLPQVIKVPYDIERNKNWTGGPIVTEDLKDVEAFAQYTPWTSETMVWLGKQVGMSPVKLEYAMKGYFGTIGGYTLMMSDSLFENLGDNRPPEKRLDEIVGIRRFVREFPLRHTQYQDDFYEMSKEITKVVSTLQKFERDMDVKGALEYVAPEKQKKYLALDEASQEVKKAAADIRAQMRFINSQPGISPHEKRRQIDQMLKLQSSLFKQAVQKMDPIVNPPVGDR